MLPVGATLRVIGDGRAGHEAQSLGVAEALGAEPDLRRIAPRRLFDWLAPFGRMDPRDANAVTPPWPDIAIAAGRRTIPALRRLKRASGGRTFTVYLNRPATGTATADLIVAPRHDGFSGANVIAPAIPANRLSAKILAAARIAPDPRVAALPGPRIALLIGGDSRHFRFTDNDAAKLAAAVRQIFANGASVMATISRRTPVAVAKALGTAIAAGPGFLWDGGDPNPYVSILACADAVLVTADSVNMASEAASTGAPIHVFWPGGSHPRITAFHAALAETGASRTWRGTPETWSYHPVNTTPAIAEAVLEAFNSARVRSCGRTHNR